MTVVALVHALYFATRWSEALCRPSKDNVCAAISFTSEDDPRCVIESATKDKGTILAEERTDLALRRTIIAAERTLMAWIRTSLSMIGFWFTIYKFFNTMPKRLQPAPSSVRKRPAIWD